MLFETTGIREDNSTAKQIKVSIYYLIIDCMLNEMRHRFSTKNLGLMEAIQSCNPESTSFLDHENLQPIITTYGLNKDSLTAECPMAKKMLITKKISSVYEVLKELSTLQTVFPNLVNMLQIILTIAVNSASCERSFSSLKRIKTWLRTTMTEERLIDLATLSIERDLSVSLDQVVPNFSSKENNRRIILS